MFFRADDVGNFHESVIDDDSEIVDRDAVGFHDDEITDTGRLKFDMAANHVIKSKDAIFSDFETDDRFSAFGFVLGFFFFGEVAAVFIIDRSLAGIELRLAAYLEKKQTLGARRLVFIVGGPYGFSPALYALAKDKLSLSKMTFSHQMVRLFFVEQVYRAMTILRGEPYHHE